MLFGNRQYETLPEEIVDIIVSNPRGAAEWETITRHIQAAALHKNKKTFREVMKRYGFPLAAITTMWGAAKHVNPMRPIGPRGPNQGALRGTSFGNLPWDAEYQDRSITSTN